MESLYRCHRFPPEFVSQTVEVHRDSMEGEARTTLSPTTLDPYQVGRIALCRSLAELQKHWHAGCVARISRVSDTQKEVKPLRL